MDIVVLGDCQSNGNNCLVHEIIPNRTHSTWSLRHSNDYDSVFRWMLKKGRKSFPSNIESIEDMAWKFLREEEKKVAWPTLLNANVFNYSVNGAHFVGYLKRLIKHIEDHGKPDLVIVTDYSPSHIGVIFKEDGQRHIFESINYNNHVWKTNRYSQVVRKTYFKRLDAALKHPSLYHVKRHRLYYEMLQRFLVQHNVPFMTVKFGSVQPEEVDCFDSFMKVDVDCSDIFREYTTTQGELSRTKLEVQQTIAERIRNQLPM